MGKKGEIKTNAMRILDGLKITYTTMSYECDEFEDAGHTADALGLPHEKVYKTLVCRGTGNNFYVYVIPIDEELDLKKCAKAVGEKSVAMIHVKELKDITGYVRGGCTSIGLKKAYPVKVDISAEALEDMYVSAGKVGCQINLKPADLLKAAKGELADLCASKS